MFGFVTYEIKVAVIMTVFYLFYRVMLSRETLHRLNRVVLVATVVLSFILPLCVITIHKVVEVVPMSDSVLSQPVEITPIGLSVDTAIPNVLGWKQILVIFYITGVLVVLLRTIREILVVRDMILRGEHHPQEDGSVIVVLDKDVSPYSWMKWIVISREDYNCSSRHHILMHEKAHIELGHAYDLLLVNILSSLQWFNPGMWSLRSDLQAIFEFEADDAVLRHGADIKAYQYSLIRKAVSVSGYSITNSFNHSILKNRITMMSKSKSTKHSGLKVLYALPVMAIILACNAKTEISYKVNENSAETKATESNAVTISVKNSANEWQYYVNGIVIPLEELGATVAQELGEERMNESVTIKCDGSVPMGALTDVKIQLRNASVLKVRYAIDNNSAGITNYLPPTKGNADRAGLTYQDTEDLFSSIDKDHLYPVYVNNKDEILYCVSSDSKGTKTFHYKESKHLATFRDDIVNLIKEHGIGVPECIFMFQCDRNTSVAARNAIEETLREAYTMVRQDYAKKTFDRSMDELSSEQRSEVLWTIPICISEVEMKDISN